MYENDNGKLTVFINNVIGAIGLITICIVTVGVFTRFVLKISIAWSDELLRTLFIWSYFIGSALQHDSEGLMSLDLFPLQLYNKGKLKSYKMIKVIQEFCILIFSAIVGYNIIKIISKQIINNQVTTTTGTPAWISPLGFLIGMTLIVLFSIKKLFPMGKQ